MKTSQRLYGSICVSDVDKKKLLKSEKNGKLYLPVTLWLNDEPDQYGNVISMHMAISKEDRDRGIKPVYIGNFKMDTPREVPATKDDTDDLPF